MNDREFGELLKVGTQLVAALADEAALSARLRRHPADELLSLDLADARRRVDECSGVYFEVLDKLGYPDHQIRTLAET